MYLYNYDVLMRRFLHENPEEEPGGFLNDVNPVSCVTGSSACIQLNIHCIVWFCIIIGFDESD